MYEVLTFVYLFMQIQRYERKERQFDLLLYPDDIGFEEEYLMTIQGFVGLLGK